ncbi:MAG: rpoN [Verrucomicrobiales bacterium]|nr:rpoN [Verrucomicrobiales bacterium]
MSIGTHLGQNLSQQQRLSPQLQQSLNILQAPVFELRQMVEMEMSQNPVLEMESSDVSTEDGPSEKELNDDGFDEEFSRLSEMDEEWRNYMQQSASRSPRTSEDEERRQFLFDSLTSPVTLQDHLVQQLGMADCTKKIRDLAEMLIGSLDDRGFLQGSLGDLSLQLGIPLVDLRAAAVIVQSLDPVGVGAEDLRDCLLIQLRRQGREHSLESRIIAGYLEDLARRRFPQIARKLSVPVSEIARAAEHIATLNPRPASEFVSVPQQYISPDVHVERSNGKYTISLNGDQLPRLRISNLYKDLMSSPGSREEVRGYIRDKIRSGKFLIRSIHQRQQTIQRIAEEIVSRQKAFFDVGPSHLKPMNMSQVADAVGVHETTVSRAISGKYIATPQGVYEMRYFFTSGVATESGEQVSNTSVKTALAEVVKGEDSSQPWSDEDLVQQLALQGIKIARRTVAKYREELNILPSHLRRQF